MSTFRPIYGSRAGIQVRNVRGRHPQLLRVRPRTRVWEGPGTRFTDDIEAAMQKKAALREAAVKKATLGGALGASPTAQDIRNAQVRVHSRARNYRLPQPVTSTSEALAAFSMLMHMAAKEAPGRGASLRKIGREAAYHYATYSPSQVLDLAHKLVGKAAMPRTAEMLRRVRGAQVRAGGRQEPFDLVAPTSDGEGAPADPAQLLAPGLTLEQRLALLPSWAPWVALATGGVLLILVTRRRPRAAPVVIAGWPGGAAHGR